MSLIRKHGAVLRAWACLALVRFRATSPYVTDCTDMLPYHSRKQDISGLRCRPVERVVLRHYLCSVTVGLQAASQVCSVSSVIPGPTSLTLH